MPRDHYTLTRDTTAQLLVDQTEVTLRQVVDASVYLTQRQARKHLDAMVEKGWLRYWRANYQHYYTATIAGRTALAAHATGPLKLPGDA